MDLRKKREIIKISCVVGCILCVIVVIGTGTSLDAGLIPPATGVMQMTLAFATGILSVDEARNIAYIERLEQKCESQKRLLRNIKRSA